LDWDKLVELEHRLLLVVRLPLVMRLLLVVLHL
jgi:hypothetical protein